MKKEIEIFDLKKDLVRRRRNAHIFHRIIIYFNLIFGIMNLSYFCIKGSLFSLIVGLLCCSVICFEVVLND